MNLEQIVQTRIDSKTGRSKSEILRDLSIEAQTLKDQGLIRFKREVTGLAESILAKRFYRSASKLNHDPLLKPIKDRLNLHLLRVAEQHINVEARAANLSPRDGQVVDRNESGWLIKADKKIHYSNRFGDYWNSAAWLCGKDNGHYFVVRVTSTCNTVQEAIDFMTPATVSKAIAKGLKVKRQGDIWLIPSKSYNAGEIEGSRHVLKISKSNQKHARLIHPEHKTIRLYSPHIAVVGKRVSSGRSGRFYD